MTASFATYASQFLNRQRSAGTSSLTSSQPLFYSFSTTDEDHPRAGHLDAEEELDDMDDPHLRTSEGIGMSRTRRYGEAEDPYLRLDEDADGSHAPSMPLLASQAPSEIPDENEPSRGWLAHQPTALRSPSPSSASSSPSPSPPPDIFTTQRLPRLSPAPLSPPRAPPPPPPLSLSAQLTESLLPRNSSRPTSLFSLPDPRFPTPRRKYHDPLYTTLFLAAVSLIYFFALLVLFLTNNRPRRQPYTTLLHTVPLLTIVTFLSAAFSYAHILLLRVFVKPIVIGTSVFIPVTLLISSIWAFVGSFLWDGDEPTWGETWGLRLFSIIPLALAIITGRRLVHLPTQVHHTSSLLILTTRVLSLQPFLLLLSPSVLLVFLLGSIPFLTLAFRLLLIGYTTKASSGTEYHVKAWADWAIAVTAVVWIWAWGVARGLCRVTTAGVVAAWYFADPEVPPPPPQSTHTIHAALYRATHPSLGTIAFSALLLTCVRAISALALFLRRAPAYLPIPLKVYAGPAIYGAGWLAGWLENSVARFGKYVLVYVGVTGDGFWASVGRATGLTAVDKRSEGWRRRFQTEPPLTLLTVTPLTLTLPFALTTYIFVAHTLNSPDQALEAAFLAGGVTALVGLFCVGLVKDTADTLYLCYCIDKEAGDRRRAEVFEMFEHNSRQQRPRQAQPQAQTWRSPAPSAQQTNDRWPMHSPGEQPPQPISRRVEGIDSPEPSPELRGTGDEVEDLDPFLRADSPDELDAQTNKPAGYAVEADGNDSVSEGSHGHGADVMPGSQSGQQNPERRGRDIEEGLGSGGLSGLFPGSDLF